MGSEVSRQKTEDRSQRTEVSRQKSEDRRQKTEVSSQKSEGLGVRGVKKILGKDLVERKKVVPLQC